jgi:hypothetical protein
MKYLRDKDLAIFGQQQLSQMSNESNRKIKKE